MCTLLPIGQQVLNHFQGCRASSHLMNHTTSTWEDKHWNSKHSPLPSFPPQISLLSTTSQGKLLYTPQPAHRWGRARNRKGLDAVQTQLSNN